MDGAESDEAMSVTGETAGELDETAVKYKLIEAASKGDIAVFKRYEVHMQNTNIADYDNRTPLHLAAVEGHLDMVKHLIEQWGVDPLAKDRWGKTAYDEAVRVDRFEVSDYLKSYVRRYRQKLDSQQYEIINAASEGDLSLLKKCHQENWSMSFSDYDKRTPLHLAAAEGHAEVVEFLIKDCNADPEVEDRWGNSPRDEAERAGHKEVADLILRLNEDQTYERSKVIQRDDVLNYKSTIEKELTARHCIRVNIVGHVEAGKTTIAKILLEKDFHKPEHTNSIDIHVYEAYATEESGWKMLREPGEFMEINDETLVYTEETKNNQNIAEQTRQSETIKGNQRQRMFSKRHISSVESFSAKKKRQRTKKSLPTFINIWDFGGQGIFHATHQLFHSTDSVYLLVVDMSKSLDDVLTDENYPPEILETLNLKTVGDICKYWINTIYANVGSTKHRPPIFLVGTHKDRMETQGTDENAEETFNKVKQLLGDPVKDQIQNQTFLLDNTAGSINEVARLKKAIFHYAKINAGFEREIPKKWIPLENAIRLKRTWKYATFQEICTMDRENLVPIDDEEEIKDFLAYQHRQGSVVFFRDLKLSEHVILDPQWLIDAFKSIITSKRFFRGEQGERDELVQNAIVREEAFEKVWREDPLKSFYPKRQILLDFLEHFGVIARPKTFDEEDRKQTEENYFYIPSLLSQKEEMVNSNEDTLFPITEESIVKKTKSLQFIMKTGILPPSQYNSTISAILRKWPILKYKGQKQLFVNRCVVVLIEDGDESFSKGTGENSQIKHTTHYGVIEMPEIPGNMMQITVYGRVIYKTSEAKVNAEEKDEFQINSRKCDQFRRFVETALKGCLERFLVDSSEKYEVCVRGEHQTTEQKKHGCGLCVVNIKNVIQQWYADSIECIEEEKWSKPITERGIARLTSAIGQNWEILCIALGLKQIQLDRIRQSKEAVAIQISRALSEWRKQAGKEATWDRLVDELTRNKTVSYDLDVIKTIMEEERSSR